MRSNPAYLNQRHEVSFVIQSCSPHEAKIKAALNQYNDPVMLWPFSRTKPMSQTLRTPKKKEVLDKPLAS
jgi:hypothetical protein